MRTMKQSMVIVGGGIGGLATAVAAARAGAAVKLLEQAQAFGEVGAGIQLGPNVVRVLQQWGLETALRRVAAFPERLEVRSALTAQVLGVLVLGARAVARYGAPYATVARVDLHSLLLQAAQEHADVDLQLHAVLASVQQDAQQVELQTTQGTRICTPLLVGADGLWSRVREHLLPDSQPRATGHLAFRAMVPQSALPALVRSQVITAWLGPKFHAVQYPVRGGEWLNVVVIVQGHTPGDPTSWDHSANAAEIRARLAYAQAPLLDLIHAIDEWRLWALYDRAPISSAAQQAQGRIALLGDAAHPMRPYLAQGAGMAIEDAQQLCITGHACNRCARGASALRPSALAAQCARTGARYPQWPYFSPARTDADGAGCIAEAAGRNGAGYALVVWVWGLISHHEHCIHRHHRQHAAT